MEIASTTISLILWFVIKNFTIVADSFIFGKNLCQLE